MSNPPPLGPGLSPLFLAAAENSPTRIKALLASGVRAHQTGPDDPWEPLCEAAYRGHLAAVDALIPAALLNDESPVHIDFRIEGRQMDYIYPLHMATIQGHVAVVARLLQANADADHEILDPGAMSELDGDVDGWTALHLAAIHNRVDIAILLLASGASPTARATTYSPFEDVYVLEITPLHVASSAAMAELLVNAGADINARTRFHNDEHAVGFLPLHTAAARNAHGLIKWLLARGANVTEFSSYGPPMRRAVLYGRIGTMRTLAAAGAPFLFDSDNDWTALHCCATSTVDTIPKMKLYFNLGLRADVNARTDARDGLKTPLQIAAYSLWNQEALPQVVDMLLARGADVRLRTNFGGTAVDALLDGAEGARPGKVPCLPRSAAAALVALLAAGGSLPPRPRPLPFRGLEAALVPVWRSAPGELRRLFHLLEPWVQAQVRTALKALHRWMPQEQALRMQILEFALQSKCAANANSGVRVTVSIINF